VPWAGSGWAERLRGFETARNNSRLSQAQQAGRPGRLPIAMLDAHEAAGRSGGLEFA